MGTPQVARTTALRGPVAVVAVRGVALLATFALSVVVARLLGASDAGLFFLLFTIGTLVATIGRWGTDVLILKVLSGRLDGGGEARRLLVIGLVTSSVVAVAAALVLPGVLADLVAPAPDVASVRLAMLCAIPSSLYLGAAAAMRGTGRVAAGTFVELGGAPLLTVAGLLLLRAGHVELGVQTAFAVLLIASVLVAAVAVPVALSRVPRGDTPESGTADVLRRHAASLSSMCGSATLFFALVWAPVLVLGIVSTSNQVAFFTASARIAAFILLIPAVQSSYLVPRFIELFHMGDVAGLNALSVRSTRQAAALGGLVAFVIVLAPSALLGLFGTAFQDEVGPLRALALGGALVCLLGQVAPLLLNTGLEHAAAVLGLIVLGCGAVLMALAGLRWGATGVAVAAAATNAGYAAYGSWMLHRRLGIETTVRHRVVAG